MKCKEASNEGFFRKFSSLTEREEHSDTELCEQATSGEATATRDHEDSCVQIGTVETMASLNIESIQEESMSDFLL